MKKGVLMFFMEGMGWNIECKDDPPMYQERQGGVDQVKLEREQMKRGCALVLGREGQLV